jgi:selenocysteine lyase/cysteine desulfurase
LRHRFRVSDGLNRLRISPSTFNDQRDVDRLLEALG